MHINYLWLLINGIMVTNCLAQLLLLFMKKFNMISKNLVNLYESWIHGNIQSLHCLKLYFMIQFTSPFGSVNVNKIHLASVLVSYWLYQPSNHIYIPYSVKIRMLRLHLTSVIQDCKIYPAFSNTSGVL